MDIKNVTARALMHVCRRWRQITFESPRRLHIHVCCTNRTPVKRCLGIWPNIPIHIVYSLSLKHIRPGDEDNIILALQHADRVSHLALYGNGTTLLLGKLATLMQKPFPILTHLVISSDAESALLLPGEFAEVLRGSAPSLQSFTLFFISLPAWPTFLLPARDLVGLRLRKIPRTDYISPEALVACLTALPRLKTFDIGFHSPTPHPIRIQPHHITRTVLPALSDFRLHGAGEYLEEFTARIDCPRLKSFNFDYYGQLRDLPATQILKFFERLIGPKLSPFTGAEVEVFLDSTYFNFHTYRPTNHPGWDWHLARTIISFNGTDWQASSMTQMLRHFSPMLSTVVYLNLPTNNRPIYLSGEPDNSDWLRFFRQLSAVRALRVLQPLAGHLAHTLEFFTGEVVAEALPSIDLIYLEDQQVSPLEKFTTVRQLSGRPVTVVETVKEFYQQLERYLAK
jgi:hypothetical protein